MLTAEEDKGGIDGPRCVPHFEPVSFRLRWTAQLVTKMFQVLRDVTVGGVGKRAEVVITGGGGGGGAVVFVVVRKSTSAPTIGAFPPKGESDNRYGVIQPPRKVACAISTSVYSGNRTISTTGMYPLRSFTGAPPPRASCS